MVDVNARIDELRDAVAEPDLTARAERLERYDNVDNELIRSRCTPRLLVEKSIHDLVVRDATCIGCYSAESTPRNIETRSRSLRLAFAVERFRIDHGSIPRTLHELVPGYLPEVPIDPYAPTRRVQYYPTAGDGYIIHCAASHGIDEIEPLPEENWNSFRVRMPIVPWLMPEESE